MDKKLKIVLLNYLSLIDSILSNSHIKNDGALIKLKNDKKFILKWLGDLSDRVN